MKKVNCILLVDDNEADNLFHSRTLRKADACNHVEVASNGQEALDYLQKCGDEAHPRPDLIFLDINMPGMNGFEFLEEYANLDPKLKSKAIVFMLTSSLMPEDSERAMKTGMVSDFLNKPLTIKTVHEILDRAF
jgi:CheY-like chemotaxis protein